MTQCLYADDAYLKQCEATVVSATENQVVLDQSVFYALGGGQPGDRGWLETAHGAPIPVLDCRRDALGQLCHMVADGAQFRAGDKVTARLDWDYRYAHMRMHTALHLLGTVLRFPVTGGNISAAKSRLDFDMVDPVDKDEVTAALNALVAADLAVTTRWITEAELDAQPELVRTLSVQPPRGAGRVRLLQIGDIDLQPCGGTHVRHTAEIGRLRVSKVEKKGRQNRRVNIVFEVT